MRAVDVVARRAAILELAEQGQRPGEIARRVGCSDDVLRLLGEASEEVLTADGQARERPGGPGAAGVSATL